LDGSRGFSPIPLKMTGRAIIRLVAFMDAKRTPIVVLERTSHL
jgi:hypothetical protein